MKEQRSYSDETLKKLQRLEVEMVKDFNYICDKYDIDYFAGGGTGIGALRHGGFIPWDDDIDFGLMRDDLKRFIEVSKIEFPEKYAFVNAEMDNNYFALNTKWMLVGTEFRDECFKDYPGELGIFLDLFCYDNIADDDKEMRKQVLSAWFWGKLLILRFVSRPTLYFSGFKATLTYIACAIAHFFLAFFHISPRFLYEKAQKYATMYNDKQTKRIGFPFDPTPYTSVLERNQVFPTKKIPFEDVEMRFPNKLEEYLEQRFGDYMQMPPEDKRHNHAPYQLSFGKYD